MDWRKLEFREVSAYRRVSERPERLGGMQERGTVEWRKVWRMEITDDGRMTEE